MLEIEVIAHQILGLPGETAEMMAETTRHLGSVHVDGVKLHLLHLSLIHICKRGQMIEVSDGYARNFLLPKKLAQEANADNINTMRMNDKATQERQAKAVSYTHLDVYKRQSSA